MMATLRAQLRRAMRWRPYRFARVTLTRPLGPRGKRSWLVVLAGIFVISLWQGSFTSGKAKIESTYRITAASGVHYDKNFTYFLYYLNLFPVISTAHADCASDTQAGCWDTAGTPAAYNFEAAKNFLETRGSTLQQDLGWTWYSGDRGKMYLFLFDAWLKGAPWNPSPKPATRLLFDFSLCALFASMWWVRRPILGALLVLFLGSNPFQLYEIHGRENVFGVNISVAILLLAIHVPLLRRWKPDPKWVFAWPILVGLLMATIRTIRSEPVTIVLAAAGTYAFVHGLSRMRRAALVGTLLASVWVGGQYWAWHWVHYQQKSAAIIKSYGGHPYPEDIRLYHHVWHPIWCGLGDFGQKYGYVWNDHNAAAFAKPLLEARGVYVPSGFFSGQTDPREYVDPETKIYKKLPYDVPYYNDIIRDKILGDIRKDPGWYLGVLAKRVHRIFTMTTPTRISWPTGFLTVPWRAWFLVPTALVLLLARSRFLLGVALFTLPSVTTALLVFSDLGVTYYGIFHIITLAVVGSIGIGHLAFWGRRALKARSGQGSSGATAPPLAPETGTTDG